MAWILSQIKKWHKKQHWCLHMILRINISTFWRNVIWSWNKTWAVWLLWRWQRLWLSFLSELCKEEWVEVLVRYSEKFVEDYILNPYFWTSCFWADWETLISPCSQSVFGSVRKYLHWVRRSARQESPPPLLPLQHAWWTNPNIFFDFSPFSTAGFTQRRVTRAQSIFCRRVVWQRVSLWFSSFLACSLHLLTPSSAPLFSCYMLVTFLRTEIPNKMLLFLAFLFWGRWHKIEQ